MAAFTVFRLIDIGELDHEDGRSDIGGALERDDYLVRAKPSELRPQRALVRRQLRQTGERHVPSRWLRRICVPAIPALPSASLWAPISALSILVVTGQSAATSAHWLDVWNVRQGPTLDTTARPFARFASASGYYTLKISAYRFLTVSACESTPSGSSFINLMSASLRTPGFSTVWECGEYWRA